MIKKIITLGEKLLAIIGYVLVAKTVVTVTLTALKSLDNGELDHIKDVQSEA